MLTPDEERTVEQVLLELTRRGQSRTAETASILERLPANPAAVERLVELARGRGLPWVEFVAQPPDAPAVTSGAPQDGPATTDVSELAAVLASPGPYPAKVEALLAAAAAPTPELAVLIRRRMAVELDPFVLATLASALASCGQPADGAVLRSLLTHSDSRVVANALETLRKLDILLGRDELASALESNDNRVGMNALALLSRIDAAQALDRMRSQLACPDPARRAGLGFLLGDLSDDAAATALLVEMMERETQTLVLKQLARSLKRHVSPPTGEGAPWRSPLRSGELGEWLLKQLTGLQTSATGAKRSVLDALVHDIEVGSGTGAIVEEDTDLSFSQVWGAPPPPPKREPTKQVQALAAPAEQRPPRSGLVWLAGPAVLCLAGIGYWLLPSSAPPQQIEPASVALRRQASARARPVQLVTKSTGSGSQRTSGAGFSGSSGGVAVPEPDTDLPVVGKKGVKVPRHFGKIGVPIDVKGVVVSKNGGSPIIKSAGRHYLIVKGPFPEEIRPGDAFHLLGKLVGRSLEGLFYVEASGR